MSKNKRQRTVTRLAATLYDQFVGYRYRLEGHLGSECRCLECAVRRHPAGHPRPVVLLDSTTGHLAEWDA